MASVKMEVLQLRDNEYDNARMPASDFASVEISVTHDETYAFVFSVTHDPVEDLSNPPPVRVRVDRLEPSGDGINIFSYELPVPGE